MEKPVRKKKAKVEVIRDRWPRIRLTIKRGSKIYEVDQRKTGTSLKQKYFKDRKKAEDFASELAKQYGAEGRVGLEMPAELRAMALTGEKILSPFGKTILQAAEFYRDFLAEKERKASSALVSVLATAWLDEKKSGNKKKLAAATITGIRQAAEDLTTAWGSQRILEVSTSDLEQYIDGLNVSLRRKENVRSLFSQFFNWTIQKGYASTNPCKPLRIDVPKADVVIFAHKEAEQVMRLCESDHTDLILYCAISLFAGLRPGEAELLTWENIHLEEQTIHVLGETSKPGETHNVHIEGNLLAWLNAYCPSDAIGPICPQGKTFTRRNAAMHAALGYKAANENPTADEWPQDVMRHSYASHWLARYGNRAQLAEYMCNSVDVIRDHYKKVVGKTATAAYWNILPRGTKENVENKKDIIRRRFVGAPTL